MSSVIKQDSDIMVNFNTPSLLFYCVNSPLFDVKGCLVQKQIYHATTYKQYLYMTTIQDRLLTYTYPQAHGLK